MPYNSTTKITFLVQNWHDILIAFFERRMLWFYNVKSALIAWKNIRSRFHIDMVFVHPRSVKEMETQKSSQTATSPESDLPKDAGVRKPGQYRACRTISPHLRGKMGTLLTLLPLHPLVPAAEAAGRNSAIHWRHSLSKWGLVE